MIERGIPTLVHANGDGAIDMLIDGVSQVAAERALPDHRTVIIHAQLMRPDQLQKAKSAIPASPLFRMAALVWPTSP